MLEIRSQMPNTYSEYKKVSGFTMVFDSIVQELGWSAALVFGVIYRFCQMKEKSCTASQQKLADRIHVNRTTVNRKIKDLIRVGYIKDLTPSLRNHPHRYIDTGKVNSMAENDEMVCAGEEQRCFTTQQPGVAQDDSKILLKDTKEDIITAINGSSKNNSYLSSGTRKMGVRHYPLSENYPAEVVPIIDYLIKEWKISPIEGREGEKAFWIKSAMELISACKPYDWKRILDEVLDEYEGKFNVSSPASLVKVCHGKSASLQRGDRSKEKDSYGKW